MEGEKTAAGRGLYFGVVGNRDHIKLAGQRLPFWHFLDELPDGWLCSLAYKRDDVPADRPRIWDCGAWSYKSLEVPRLGRDPVTPQWALAHYQKLGQEGDMVIAPDHMLLPSADLEVRREFNRASAITFLSLARGTGLVPMACIHGATMEERLAHARWLLDLGYRRLALGGLAGQASRRRMVLEVVGAVREATEGAWLHVLGLSAPSYVAEWRQLGIDSCDGASHFKQAFTAGKFFVERDGALVGHQAARAGEPITAPRCECRACTLLRGDGIDTRCYGSNETNMGRAAHNLNHLIRALNHVRQRTVVLVACVAEKRNQPAPAADLYQSPWFKKARRYAERYGNAWHILSAQHGLVAPDTTLTPYNRTLNEMSAGERRGWGEWVAGQVTRETDPNRDRLIILAGRNYRDSLLPHLEARGYRVEVPMEGLGIGQQLQWLAGASGEGDLRQLSLLEASC